MKIERLNRRQKKLLRERIQREINKKRKKEKYFKKRKNKRRVRPTGGVNGFSPLRLRGQTRIPESGGMQREKEQRKGVVVEEK